MQILELPFPLLSLPALALNAVIRCLKEEDKLSLASCCKQLATAVSAASKDSRLTVTDDTRWSGLSKVLGSNTMSCKTLALHGSMGYDTCSALHVLLKPEPVPGISFPGIKKANIVSTFVPDTVAQACKKVLERVALTDLDELDVDWRAEQYEDIHPIPYCSQLRKLVFSGQLPDQHHTAEDLQRQLPNVTSLKLLTSNLSNGNSNSVDTMLSAWGKNLTELNTRAESAKLQHCTCLNSLTWNRLSRPPIEYLLPSLTKLHLKGEILESDLKTILQLPLLRILEVAGFQGGLHRDWSQYPCSWQQLSVTSMNFVDLVKLPLHSLKGQGGLTIQSLRLPDPQNPQSIVDVTNAAQCVARLGIPIEGFEEWLCTFWHSLPEDPEIDKASMHIVQAASSIVQPFSKYDPDQYPISGWPLTTAAIFRWASPALLDLHYANDAGSLLMFWQALRCCSKVQEVASYHMCSVRKHVDVFRQQVQLAAEHLVAVARRPVALVMTCSSTGNPSEDEQLLCKLKHDLQETIPTSVTLQECSWDIFEKHPQRKPNAYLIIKLGPA